MVLMVCALIAIYHPTRFNSNSRGPKASNISAQVLVLGDIGRSPRMQYHALSIAKHGGHVQLIGYRESSLLPALLESENVVVWALRPPPRLLSKLPFIIAGPLKVLYQIYELLLVLLYRVEPSKWLIVQNPPSIPTLMVAAIACRARGTRLLIDWHNYGWTILAGTRGQRHPFVRASKIYEAFFGRFAPTANLAVTAAMRADLQTSPYNLRTPIAAMHDRPAAIFQPVGSQQERRAFLYGIEQTADYAEDILAGKVRLLVSSTSWTPDEDFGILLDALVLYAAAAAAAASSSSSSSPAGRVPPLLVIITGRGPQKAKYEAEMARLAASGRLTGVEIRTAFLSFEDYARLLAAADLGICLHMSSSGLDLPMKVVDMFGAGLPVLAYSQYQSFGELVREGVNGVGFVTAEELEVGLVRLLDPSSGELARLKAGAVKEGSRRWDEEWDEVVKPILELS
ncbi:family 33 glycosyltransferase [Cryphonectria parasitica EP155]|uniref:Chitobiosyldiphosphodolichol beta-mannosyltransferase n=1 Tax=Cryphonectria parasitica (strain ATCC 38755 / EP155) TaxID=660469 RepID=A0A9P4Y5R5_CRYP1|nr:family 33 glycosyltransferase [Cryphonectria parasitica EP155]KAF3766991.1 family 33 glycosyltransferase [Cryphonectria parasitica EP155]